MGQLTKPSDLVKPVNKVEELLRKVEAEFKADNSFDPATDVRQPPRRTVEVVGEYTAAERAEVCRQYRETGWHEVNHMQLQRGDDKVARFTFIAKK